MTLFDLTPAQFATYLAIGAAAVVVLYMLKLRRRTVLISFAPLWRKAVRDRSATSLLERLRRILSVLMQLAFVALVLFAIARPRLGSDVERERRFVIVVDASGAMQATDASGRTRLDEAKALAREVVRQLGETDRAMIVRAARRAEPITAFESNRDALASAVDALETEDCASDLDASVRFARVLVAGHPERVIVLTHRVSQGDDVTWRRVGTPRDNVAITRFAARPALESPGEYELLAAVCNYGRSDAEVRLRIETDAGTPVLIAERPMHLVPGGTVREVIRGIVREDMRLRARLVDAQGGEHVDGLALDDRAFTVVTASRIIRVTVVGPENRFLNSVLEGDPLVLWKRVETHDASDDADVVIFDRTPMSAGVARAIVIAPMDDSPVKTSGTIRDVFVDHLASGHPVMRFVGELADLNIAESRVLVLQAGDEVLASCAGSPVMLARERDASRVLVIGFDLTRSDLVLRVAFPKIMRNALAWLVSGDVLPEPTTLTCGEFGAPTHVGFHEIARRTVAVNVSDPAVSDLRGEPEAAEAPTVQLAESRAALGVELWPALVVLALALTLLEWFSYHRRWTV